MRTSLYLYSWQSNKFGKKNKQKNKMEPNLSYRDQLSQSHNHERVKISSCVSLLRWCSLALCRCHGTQLQPILMFDCESDCSSTSTCGKPLFVSLTSLVDLTLKMGQLWSKIKVQTSLRKTMQAVGTWWRSPSRWLCCTHMRGGDGLWFPRSWSRRGSLHR